MEAEINRLYKEENYLTKVDASKAILRKYFKKDSEGDNFGFR